MNPLKNLFPVLILLTFSAYAYLKYPELPRSLINGIIFLPVVLAILITGVTIHFNRSQVFFYSLLIICANMVLGLELARSELAYALLSTSLPLLLLVISLLPDRGILSLKALPLHAILLTTLMFSLLMIKMSPGWINHILLTHWFPERYFDWTGQSQSVLMISALSILVMIVVYALKPTTLMAAGLGILILLICQLYFGPTDSSINVFSTIAFLMCLYAILQESWRMAYLDELTELPARRALREKFQQLGGSYSVAMLDVDHFKKFNDTYGHDTGDAVLRMIATKLRKVTGGGRAYRYGGEEFSVLFNNKDKTETLAHLEDLRESIAATPFVVYRANSRRSSDKKVKPAKNKTVTVTVSIGVADSSDDKIAGPWEVLKQADKMLYRAKGKGRNCVVC